MDQRQAFKLAPCMANYEVFNTPVCRNFTWPVKLSFKLNLNGRDLTAQIHPSTASSGGQYLGKEAYIWQVGYVALRPQVEYKLEASSLSDGTSLAPAHPRLVLSVADPGYLEDSMLEHFIGLPVAAFAAMTAALWATRNLARARRSLP
jgi:hypothetical protein